MNNLVGIGFNGGSSMSGLYNSSSWCSWHRSNLIMAMYEDTTCCVKKAEGNSRKFPILSGVKQGRMISLLLSTVVIDLVLRSVDSPGLHLNDGLLSDQNFADDITILETCKSRLQALLTSVQKKQKVLHSIPTPVKPKAWRLAINLWTSNAVTTTWNKWYISNVLAAPSRTRDPQPKKSSPELERLAAPSTGSKSFEVEYFLSLA